MQCFYQVIVYQALWHVVGCHGVFHIGVNLLNSVSVQMDKEPENLFLPAKNSFFSSGP